MMKIHRIKSFRFQAKVLLQIWIIGNKSIKQFSQINVYIPFFKEILLSGTQYYSKFLLWCILCSELHNISPTMPFQSKGMVFSFFSKKYSCNPVTLKVNSLNYSHKNLIRFHTWWYVDQIIWNRVKVFFSSKDKL